LTLAFFAAEDTNAHDACIQIDSTVNIVLGEMIYPQLAFLLGD
jgi:hypothetical protein